MSRPNPSPPSGLLVGGTRLGAYEVVELIAMGGMGQVYRARDLSLGRDVALKVLPDDVATDPDRRARFEREARVVAALNHPNIVTIHAVGESDGRLFIAMELVRGVSLASLIPSDGMPLAQLLAVAVAMAEAVSAAHAIGITHRDLKPANVMVGADGAVKVLDFGIAKQRVAGPAADSVTATGPLATRDGHVLGTPAYMAPEQVQGLGVDARSDVFSFGVVLYEMASGRRPFAGDTDMALVAAILRDAPTPVTAVNRAVPKELARIIRRALAKDPARRQQSATDLRNELDDLRREFESGELAGGGASQTLHTGGTWPTRWWLVTLGAVAALAVAATMAFRAAPRATPVNAIDGLRFEIQTPADHPLNIATTTPTLAMAPDGRTIAYVTASALSSGGNLATRALDDLRPRVVGGVNRAREPFFSADGQWLGYQGERGLEKVPVGGGQPRLIAAVSGAVRGAAWLNDGTIVFATMDPASGLLQVSNEGGALTVLTTPDGSSGEADHLFPAPLPGDRGVLFTTVASTGAHSVAVVDLQNRTRKVLIPEAACARYAADGHLVYASGRTLYAVPFNLQTLTVGGDAVVLADRVLMGTSGCAYFATSATGVLAFVPADAGNQPPRTMVWVDRTGIETPIPAPPRAYQDVRLSPDGSRVAVSIAADDRDVWTWDFGRDALTRITSHPAADRSPVWTPDGRQLVFASVRHGANNLFRQSADGSGSAERLTESGSNQVPFSITANGRYLLGNQARLGPWDLFRLALASPAAVEPLLELPGNENYPVVSPNSRFVAYASDESGTFQVFVRPFPAVGSARWQVSQAGGQYPHWSRDGRELSFRDEAGRIVAAPVDTTIQALRIGAPAIAVARSYAFSGDVSTSPFDVSLDGRRYLVVKAGDTPAPSPRIVVGLARMAAR